MDNRDLRIGIIGQLYFDEVLNQSVPRQLQLLDDFFPGLIVEEILPVQKKKKISAVYQDADRKILAARYKTGYYTGSSTRVIQILGRLIGTAKGSVEKERRTAGMIQDRIAGELATSPEKMAALRDTWACRFDEMDADCFDRFIDIFTDYINGCTARFDSMSDDEREQELFPLRREVFLDLMFAVISEWNQGFADSYANAFTWLLMGALLRNEVSRLIFVYNTDFEPRREHCIHEGLEAFYEGDDMDRRFPGIEWYCDRCGAHLNGQTGFNDFGHVWKCTACGFRNVIEVEEIYDSEEDYREGRPTDKGMLFRALRERARQLEAAENPLPAEEQGQD